MTTSDTLGPELQAFFEDFCRAFANFDGALIARRYAEPYLAVDAEGGLRSFASRQQIGDYFQRVLDDYHHQGCRRCRFDALQYQALGGASVLASVTWQLLREDESLALSWRESYTLVRTPEGLRIFASIDHAS